MPHLCDGEKSGRSAGVSSTKVNAVLGSQGAREGKQTHTSSTWDATVLEESCDGKRVPDYILAWTIVFIRPQPPGTSGHLPRIRTSVTGARWLLQYGQARSSERDISRRTKPPE